MDQPDCGIDGPNGDCIAHIQVHGNVNTVMREGEEFCHADARLIASAPELLDACYDALGALSSHWGVPIPPAISEQVTAALEAAIKKARG